MSLSRIKFSHFLHNFFPCACLSPSCWKHSTGHPRPLSSPYSWAPSCFPPCLSCFDSTEHHCHLSRRCVHIPCIALLGSSPPGNTPAMDWAKHTFLRADTGQFNAAGESQSGIVRQSHRKSTLHSGHFHTSPSLSVGGPPAPSTTTFFGAQRTLVLPPLSLDPPYLLVPAFRALPFEGSFLLPLLSFFIISLLISASLLLLTKKRDPIVPMNPQSLLWLSPYLTKLLVLSQPLLPGTHPSPRCLCCVRIGAVVLRAEWGPYCWTQPGTTF